MKTSVKTSARAAAARETAIVTVAAVREHDRQVQYLFNERQRIYTMISPKGALSSATNLLNIAARETAPVKVSLDAYRGVIERVEKPRPEALREFESKRVPLEEAREPLRLDLDKIDPSVFNIVD